MSNSKGDTYYQSLPANVRTELEAGAFRSLVSHLQARTSVQNMELMTLAGFCRNCLAKWLVLHARKLSDGQQEQFLADGRSITSLDFECKCQLDALGYDETAEEVYGMGYKDWKSRYQTKATDEQMQRFEASSSIHATHDKNLLKVRRGEKPSNVSSTTTTTNVKVVCNNPPPRTEDSSLQLLLSDVCCQDVDNYLQPAALSTALTATAANVTNNSSSSLLFSHVSPPPLTALELTIGVLTVSDRAHKHEYSTGDLSGPSIENSLMTKLKSMNNTNKNTILRISKIVKAIVPDERNDIHKVLSQWSGKDGDKSQTATTICDIIFTTGGTGFSKRDVTPEVTRAVLDRECRGLMSWVSNELSCEQPLAALSRGICGVSNKTIIANCPGNPKGASDVVGLLFPLLLHAVRDIQED